MLFFAKVQIGKHSWFIQYFFCTNLSCHSIIIPLKNRGAKSSTHNHLLSIINIIEIISMPAPAEIRISSDVIRGWSELLSEVDKIFDYWYHASEFACLPQRHQKLIRCSSEVDQNYYQKLIRYFTIWYHNLLGKIWESNIWSTSNVQTSRLIIESLLKASILGHA